MSAPEFERVPITEAACQRLRGYVDNHRGACWCGFDGEDWNDQQATLDHAVHSLVDDWPNFLAALAPTDTTADEGGAR